MQRLSRWCLTGAVAALLVIMMFNWLFLRSLTIVTVLARRLHKRLDGWTEALLRKIDPSRPGPVAEVKGGAPLVPLSRVEPDPVGESVFVQPIVYRESSSVPRRPARKPTPPPQRPEENNPWGE